MRAAFTTLGCKVNQYETAALQQQFAAGGFEIVSPSAMAEVYVINSCTVTAQGDKKSRQLLRRLRRQNPAAVVVLCGCFPQAFPEEAAQLTEADIIAGSTDRAALLGLVLDRLAHTPATQAPLVRISPHQAGEVFEPLQVDRTAERTRAFVKIQDGCERFCSYCIIPTARGPMRSKPPGDIRAELETLALAGYREVVLAGINLSCYGVDLGLTLLDAVSLACGIPGIDRVRLGSLEPELLTPEIIGKMAELPGLCPQFHLSLQSGCDQTLQRMRRHYNTQEYLAIVNSLRAAFPDCAITTDIMVGFPGEDEAEFQASLAFARQVSFARVHVFAYSRRPGTLADTLPNQVDEDEKVQRSRRMIEATDRDRHCFLEAQIGRLTSVLLETRDAHGLWAGYTPNYTPVRLRADNARSGDLLPAYILVREGEHCLGQPQEQAVLE